jgi:hypothetical protein
VLDLEAGVDEPANVVARPLHQADALHVALGEAVHEVRLGKERIYVRVYVDSSVREWVTVNLASSWFHQDIPVVYANRTGGLEVALGEAVHQVCLDGKRVWVRVYVDSSVREWVTVNLASTWLYQDSHSRLCESGRRASRGSWGGRSRGTPGRKADLSYFAGF